MVNQDGLIALIKKTLIKENSLRVLVSAARVVGNLGEAAARDPILIETLLKGLSGWKFPEWQEAAEALGKLAAAPAGNSKVLQTMATVFHETPRLAMPVLFAWDRQGLRIFRTPDGFTVRTIAELTQPART